MDKVRWRPSKSKTGNLPDLAHIIAKLPIAFLLEVGWGYNRV